LTAHYWEFPIIGKTTYLGFYDIDDAKEEAAKLKAKGLDVHMRGVNAYSTLGYFRDPLTSSMVKEYHKGVLAEVMFHEMTHTTIYLFGQTSFNESLAGFVGEEGSLVFIKDKYGKKSKLYKEYKQIMKDGYVWDEYSRYAYKQMVAFYKKNKLSDPDFEKKRAKKFKSLKRIFKTRYMPRIWNKGYLDRLDANWNNAYVMAHYTYTTKPGLFKKLYKKEGSDMSKFISKISKLKSRPKGEDPYVTLERLIDTP